jgi:3-deoxy-D-arabino-heptulosonate 7-phosphate (DAHP) synthase
MRRREFVAGLGGAVAWPLLVSAQQRSKPIIGWLDVGARGTEARNCRGVSPGFGAEVGFSEDRDVTVEPASWAHARVECTGLLD